MAETKSITHHPRFKDLTGKRFGKWTVICEAQRIRGRVYWRCRCECGAEGCVQTSDLNGEKSRNCTACSKNSTIHGMHGMPEYIVWKRMRSRCSNPATAEYDNYGGRGICVCDRWNDFSLFFSDMGPRPSPKHSIDRVDNDSGYSPENCKWSTRKEQARNSRKNRFLTFNGKTQCIAAWEEDVGIKQHAIAKRLRLGWSVERALTTAVKHGCS